MVARKRKANPEYNDETPVKKPKTNTKTTSKRAKVDRTDPDWLVTNESSPLSLEGLHAELSDPKTYEGFTKEDWEDLRETLPDDIPLSEDGYSIAIDFLKYDLDFRNGVREFQEDLGSGRLEPDWLAAAADAMEQRARGDFDAFKEKEYEEFWGQKQKLSYEARAGESTTLRLEIMVEHGVFRVGDEITFNRTIGRKEKRILLEKECKVINLGHKTMTLAIPPGQLKFLRHSSTPLASQSNGATPKKNGIAGISIPSGQKEDSDKFVADTAMPCDQGESTLSKENQRPGKSDTSRDAKPAEDVHENGNMTGNSEQEDTISSQSPPDLQYDNATLHEINNLKQLNDKIIEIDGRLDPNNRKEVPAASPWKLMRLRRNNQDLGTLFEVREEFYVYKLPEITKSSKE